MIDQIIEFNIMSPLLGDGYKAGGIGETIIGANGSMLMVATSGTAVVI